MSGHRALLSGINPIQGISLTTVFNILLLVIILGVVFFLVLRMMKFKYAVEIVQLNPLRIFKDRGQIQRHNGVQRLMLLKEKKHIYDYKLLPMKGGLLGKKDKIYLAKDESGDLRPLDIGNISFAFSKDDGQIIDLIDTYIKDEEGNLMPIRDGDIVTEDGREVMIETMPRFIPQNNDVKSSFTNAVMETVQKYHLPSFWQQAQVFMVIIAGLIVSIMIYIVNKFA